MNRPPNSPFSTKITDVLFTMALTVALALPLTAQQPHNVMNGAPTGTAMKVNNMAGNIETSTIVAAVQGPPMNLWLMTWKTGVIISRDERGNLTGLDGSTEPTPADRYVIRLAVTDTTILRNIGDALATVLVVSPSAANTLIDLEASDGGYGCALTLAEKGEYRFTVRVVTGRESRLTQFRYAVK